MKKIFILALNIALAGSMCSCSDFLDREPKNTVDPETTVDEDVAVSMANACYRTLQSSNMYNQRLWTLDIVAGNSIVGAGGGTDGIETVQASNFTTQSDNGMALYMWRSPWSVSDSATSSSVLSKTRIRKRAPFWDVRSVRLTSSVHIIILKSATYRV